MEYSESFFEGEERCGYFVKPQIKELWAVELEMLKRFSEVCDKHGLRWWAMGGTLLGAVRHKGFIPWDDDVDLIMPREDYNRLLEIGPQEFTAPYFFQVPATEEIMFRTHIKLRDDRTTGVTHEDRNRDIHRGIFMDIFVLDEVPESLSVRRRHRRRTHALANRGRHDAFWRENKNPFKRLLYGLQSLRIMGGRTPAERFEMFQRECSRYAGSGSGKVAHTSLTYREAVVWDRCDWDEWCEVPFENITVRIPKGYDNILTRHYGDWRAIPECKEGGASHDAIEFDAKTPYTEYFKSNC